MIEVNVFANIVYLIRYGVVIMYFRDMQEKKTKKEEDWKWNVFLIRILALH